MLTKRMQKEDFEVKKPRRVSRSVRAQRYTITGRYI